MSELRCWRCLALRTPAKAPSRDGDVAGSGVGVPLQTGGVLEGGGGGEEGTLRKWVVSLEQSVCTLFLSGINSFKARFFD